MSTTVQARSSRQKASRSGPRTKRTGMLDALHAEWTKLRTVSGPAWLLLGVVALTAAVSAAADGATHCPAGMSCPVDPTKLSLTGTQAGQAVVAILAVLTICNEYSTGLIRVTFTAMPRRLLVYAAKAVIIAAVVLAAGAVAVLGSVTNARMMGNRYKIASTAPMDTAESRTRAATPRLSSAIRARYSTDPVAARSVGP